MEQQILNLAGHECRVFVCGRPRCLLVQPSARHETPSLGEEFSRIAECSGVAFAGVAFQVTEWDLDLTPWHDDAINRDPKVGSATGDTLRFVEGQLLPEMESRFGKLPVILGGYSLAGLFSVWASMQSARFSAVAAASPSLWIRDWLPFAEKNPVRTPFVYLSLGDREEHVKNRSIARVGDAVRGQYQLLKQQLGESNCTLVWESGGHFSENARRLADAFFWCLRKLAESAHISRLS